MEKCRIHCKLLACKLLNHLNVFNVFGFFFKILSRISPVVLLLLNTSWGLCLSLQVFHVESLHWKIPLLNFQNRSDTLKFLFIVGHPYNCLILISTALLCPKKAVIFSVRKEERLWFLFDMNGHV